MASCVYNIFKQKVADGTYRWNANSDGAGGTYEIALVEAVLSDPDPDTVTAALTGGNEYDGSYSRTAVANLSVILDDTNNRAKLDADDTTVSSVGLDAGGQKVEGVLLYVKPNGTSADSSYIPAAFIDLATAFYGNGSNVTFTWDSVGLITLT